MLIERFDPEADEALTRAWFALYAAGVPVDQPGGPAMSFGVWGGLKARGWCDEPRENWLALAAAYSGGSVVPAEYGVVEAKPEQTASAIRAAILIALSGLARDSRDRIMTACLEDGIQLARGEPGSSR